MCDNGAQWYQTMHNAPLQPNTVRLSEDIANGPHTLNINCMSVLIGYRSQWAPWQYRNQLLHRLFTPFKRQKHTEDDENDEDEDRMIRKTVGDTQRSDDSISVTATSGTV